MASKAELERLDRLLADQEKVIRDAVIQFVATIRSKKLVKAITDKIKEGDIGGAISIMDSHIEKIGNAIPQSITNVGVSTAAELQGLVSALPIAILFDPTHGRAAAMIRRARLEFISDFTTKQRAATRAAMATGFQEGLGYQAMARRFVGSVGLTPYQLGVVENYRNLLASGSKEALHRELRDRRFDRTLERGKPLTEEQITRMTDRYRDNMIASRADTIARTEGLNATSIAREEAARQMAEQAGVPVDSVIGTWNTTRDERRRAWHATMQGQKRKLGQPFVDGLGNNLMYPGDQSAPAETVINCRCVKTFTFG